MLGDHAAQDQNALSSVDLRSTPDAGHDLSDNRWVPTEALGGKSSLVNREAPEIVRIEVFVSAHVAGAGRNKAARNGLDRARVNAALAAGAGWPLLSLRALIENACGQQAVESWSIVVPCGGAP